MNIYCNARGRQPIVNAGEVSVGGSTRFCCRIKGHIGKHKHDDGLKWKDGDKYGSFD